MRREEGHTGSKGRGRERETDSKWRQLGGLELQLWHRLALEFNYVARLFFFYLAFLFFGTQNRDKIIAKFLELPKRGEGAGRREGDTEKA